jgi:hypothetical protein
MNSLDEEKLFYERFWCLLNDRQLMAVFGRFGPAVFRRSSVLEGFEKFIVAHGFKGDTCIEIGTLNALTAVVLARYFRRVVTVDIVDTLLRHEVVSLLGVGNIEFRVVKNNAAKAEVIEMLQFDAAYVDGDHARDTESDFALVRRAGRVLMHEHWAAQPAVTGLAARLPGRVETQGKFALWTA